VNPSEHVSATSRRLGPDFARFWTAQGASAVGGQISELAVPLLAVLVLGASAAEVGLLGAARWVPFLVLALPLGVLVDRRRRRPLLVTAAAARAALTLVVVALASSGALTLPALVCLVGLFGAFTVVSEVGYQSFLPTVAGRGLVGEALGTRAGIALGCAGTLLTVVWVVASPLRRVGDPRLLAAHEGQVGP